MVLGHKLLMDKADNDKDKERRKLQRNLFSGQRNVVCPATICVSCLDSGYCMDQMVDGGRDKVRPARVTKTNEQLLSIDLYSIINLLCTI